MYKSWKKDNRQIVLEVNPSKWGLGFLPMLGLYSKGIWEINLKIRLGPVYAYATYKHKL